MFTSKTSLIIPTKDRSKKIIDLLNKLTLFRIKFNEILVIDSSNKYHSQKIFLYCKKKKIKYCYSKPSTSHQRNIGLKEAKSNKFVMFMDDDVLLHKDTLKNMNTCIKKNYYNSDIGGFGFNQIENIKEGVFDKIKKFKLLKYFEIYPNSPGLVSRSGWHSKILNLKKKHYGRLGFYNNLYL